MYFIVFIAAGSDNTNIPELSTPSTPLREGLPGVSAQPGPSSPAVHPSTSSGIQRPRPLRSQSPRTSTRRALPTSSASARQQVKWSTQQVIDQQREANRNQERLIGIIERLINVIETSQANIASAITQGHVAIVNAIEGLSLPSTINPLRNSPAEPEPVKGRPTRRAGKVREDDAPRTRGK